MRIFFACKRVDLSATNHNLYSSWQKSVRQQKRPRSGKRQKDVVSFFICLKLLGKKEKHPSMADVFLFDPTEG
jgi:hypothetical protein